MSTTLQRVYLGRDNVTDLTFKHVDNDGIESALDLSPVVKTILIVHGALAGADVLINSNAVSMTWDALGNFKAWLGDVALDEGDFWVTVVFFDAGHPDGQIAINPEAESRLMFRVVAV